MYHDVSLLECLSKSFLPLRAGRSRGRTSIHESMQKAKGYKKELPGLALCYETVPFLYTKYPLNFSYESLPERTIRSFRTESFDYFFFLLFLVTIITRCSSTTQKTTAEIAQLSFLYPFRTMNYLKYSLQFQV